MFDIICLGRMDFLMAVLNGLAMLTADDGPAGYGGMVALGLLIGVLLAMIKGVVTQKLELQWVLAGWLLFSCLFVPKVTVTVEDIYTGTTNSVANVPLGPAAIGSITSTIGVRLAEAFEAVFGYPTMTGVGYMDSLDLINGLREMDYGSANDGSAANYVANVNMQQTLREYLTRCVMHSMAMGIPGIGPNWSQLRESDDLLATINVPSDVWFTTVYLDQDEPRGVATGCGSAYQQIRNFMTGTFYLEWRNYIGSQLDLADPELRIQDALDAIFGIGNDAQNFMLNALLKREIELAEIGHHAAGGNDAGVLMRVQAMEQRRTEWAAGQSMFAEMARPAISFIEGFFYAVSPFMGFMFCLGAPGITIFSRYLVFAVWVQLWMPVLAVCNLYITIAASNDLQRIASNGTNLLSMTGLDSVWTETASWLAFGGNMIAAVPLLTFILISGSYFALTRLTDRLSGGDHINEKIQSPDIMAPAAYATVGAMGMQQARFNADPQHGMRVTGFENLVRQLNFSSATSSSVQSAETAREQAQQQWSSTLSSTLNLSNQQNQSAFSSEMKGYEIGSSSSQMDSLIDHMAASATKSAGLSSAWLEQNASVMRTALGAALQGERTGVSPRMGIDQSLQNLRSVTEEQRKQIGDAIEKSVATNSNFTTQLMEKQQLDKSEGVESRFFKGMGVTDAGQWLKARSDSVAAERDFKRAISRQESFGSTLGLNTLIVGNLAAQDGWTDKLQHLAYTKELSGLERTQIDDRAGYLSQRGGVSQEVALGMAAAEALFEGSHEAKIALMDVLQQHGFGSKVSREDPQKHKDLEGYKPAFGIAQGEAEANVVEVKPGAMGAVRDRVDGGLGSMKNLETEGRAAVDDFLKAKQEGSLEKVRNAMEKIEHVVAEQRAAHYENTFQETRGPMKAWNDLDIAGSATKSAVILGETIGAAAADVKSAGEAAADRHQGEWTRGLYALGAGIGSLPSAIASGANKVDEEYESQAKAEALAAGLPEVAAQFYAERHMIMLSPTTIGLQRMFGMDEEYEKHKAETRELLGEKAFTMLSRAAIDESVAKRQGLDGAAAIYKRDAHEREVKAATENGAVAAQP